MLSDQVHDIKMKTYLYCKSCHGHLRPRKIHIKLLLIFILPICVEIIGLDTVSRILNKVEIFDKIYLIIACSFHSIFLQNYIVTFSTLYNETKLNDAISQIELM